MKCIICFESGTGLRPNDYFVSTLNDHKFHYCCALKMVKEGTPWCPICDEDLRNHPFTRLNSQGAPLPPRPAHSPSKTAMDTAPIVFTSDGQSAAPPTPVTTSSSANPILRSRPKAQPNHVSFQVEPDHTFKIVILGDINVGKSSLIQRYSDEHFDPFQMTTTGCDLRVKTIQVGAQIVRLNIWDTAGQERHRALVDMYLRRVDGIIFCFDITNEQSFQSLQAWHEFAMRTVPPDTVKIIVGNKSDMWSECVVHSARVQALSDNWNTQYLFSSAKDATNVEAIFRSLTALILETRIPSTVAPSAPPVRPIRNPESSQHRSRRERQSPVNPFYYNPHGTEPIQLSSPEKDKKKKKDCCDV